MNIIEKFKKTVKMPYYYVGQCPHCGSYATGRYVKLHRRTEVEWQVDESLKNGELVRMKADLVGPNCFCIECDNDFTYPVKLKMASLAEMNMEKESPSH